MLNQAHRFIITCLIFLWMFTPAFAVGSNTIPVTRDVSEGSRLELIQNEIKVEDLDIDPINTKSLKDTVIPDPQKEGKKVIGLFLKTMALVAFCAVVLYLILVFIKKFYSSAFINNNDSKEIEKFDLSSPDSKQDALRSFLNRTK